MPSHHSTSRTVSHSLRPLLQRVAWVAFAAIGLLIPTAPSQAQGLFEQLFGFGGPKPAVPRPLRIPTSPSVFPNNIQPIDRRDSAASEASGGTFRTICVRMCDGSFVPISFATRRDQFFKDQNKCQATCGEDARLFYHSNPGGSLDDATDLSGKPYVRLPNAFRFRKARVEGCSCRPPPWSEAELARHQSYASAAIPAAAATMRAAAVMQSTPPAQATKMALAALGATPADTTKAGAAGPADTVATPASKPNLRSKKQQTTRSVAPKLVPQPNTRVAAATPKPSLFGTPTGTSMGLGAKPKFVWPGD